MFRDSFTMRHNGLDINALIRFNNSVDMESLPLLLFALSSLIVLITVSSVISEKLNVEDVFFFFK